MKNFLLQLLIWVGASTFCVGAAHWKPIVGLCMFGVFILMYGIIFLAMRKLKI